jgi:O-antigen/teichoic acid export membrane protein
VSLRKTTFSASRWTATSTLLVAAIQVLQTSVLARILLPSEFGLMAVVAAAVATLMLIVDLGLSQALIHYDDVPERHRSSIFWLNVVLAFALMAALCMLAPTAALFYHSAALAPLLCLTSLMFPLAAAGQQLRALAAKDLRFNALAYIEIISAACACACGIVAAVMHAGVYALAIAVLANTAIGSLLAWLTLPRRYRPGLHFRPREAWAYLSFGGYLVGESIANAIHRNADVFAGGLVVGAKAIGVYSVPRDLSLRLANGINSIVTRVGFPVMSQVKHDHSRLKSIYLQTLRMTTSVNFPAFVAMSVFANEIVALLYGPRWTAAAAYLRILAAWGLIRSTGSPVGSLLYATGRTQRAFWWNIASLLALPALYWASTRGFGLPGLAWAAVAIQLALLVPSWYFLVRPSCGATLSEYLTQFSPPLACALAAGATAWMGAHGLPHGTLRLAVGGLIGSTVYLGTSALVNRPWLIAIRELFGVSLRKKR